MWCELRWCWGQWWWLKMSLLWSLGSLAVLLTVFLLLKDTKQCFLIGTVYVWALLVSPCHFGKQLLFFNLHKPLVSHQKMSLLKCNPLTSVTLLCSSYAHVLGSTGSRVSECAKDWENLNIRASKGSLAFLDKLVDSLCCGDSLAKKKKRTKNHKQNPTTKQTNKNPKIK